MIDHLKQMAIFAKTIDHGSFRGAARELRLSPSVVSHHIAQLEEHLGVALLYRSTRRLTLTREGERLLGATRGMLDAAEGALLQLSEEAALPSGELRVTVPSVLSQSQFTDQIAAFADAHPRVRLELDFSDTRRGLIEDGFDLALRMGPGFKPSATTRRLARINRKLVAAPGYVASRGPVRDPKDLLTWDWLTLTPAEKIPVAFRKSGRKAVTIKPQARLYANDAQALYRLARAGLGLAIVPEFLADDDLVSGDIASVLNDWALNAVDVVAQWPANAPRHGLIHLLVDTLGAGASQASS